MIACFLFSLTIALSPALAADPTQENYGLEESLKVGNVKDAMIKGTPTSIAGTVISSILSLIGVAFFLLILYGGLRWMMAQGSESEVEKAKQIIIAAVVGLIIILSAYALTAFIGGKLTGTTVDENPQTEEDIGAGA
jgi:hypothetical protein